MARMERVNSAVQVRYPTQHCRKRCSIKPRRAAELVRWAYRYGQMSKKAALFSFLVALATHAFGADVSLQKDSWGDPIVDISGPIEKGDLLKIKKASAALIRSLDEYTDKGLQFHLNTAGGDIEEAMRIGRFARDLLVKIDSYGKIIIASKKDHEYFFKDADKPWAHRDYVILSPDASLSEKHIVRNYSAGVLIFYGAVIRAHRDNSDQRLGFYRKKSIPVIGLHRPYYGKAAFSKLSPHQAEQAYRTLEKNVRNYLAEMGAPQQLIDRMFNRASTDIDLVPDDEFRKFYKSEESFLEEWLIARCGASGHENVLSGTALKDFMVMQRDQMRSRMADSTNSDKDPWYLYPSPSFSQDYVETLYRKVRTHNRSVNACQSKAVSIHQRKWARTYK